MIPRLSIAGTACLVFLSGFEQIFCFAAAAPAPRIGVERPKHYFPRHVKRIVTNGTQSQSQTQTSTKDLDAEKSALLREKSTQTPTNTLNQISSQPLALSLESLLTSLIPASFIGGIQFIQTTPISSASPSSADSSSRPAFSVNPNIVSLSITPPGIAASTTTPSFTQPLSNVAVSSSNTPVHTASTFSRSFGVVDFPDSLGTGALPKRSGTPSLSSKFEPSIIRTVSSQGSLQSSTEPVSTSRAPESSQTSFASTAKVASNLGTDSSIIRPLEEVSSKPAPSASKSITLGALSPLADSKTNATKSDDSAFQSVPTTTLSSLKTGAVEFGASVTAPPKTVPVSSGTLGPSQSNFGELALTKSRAADQIINDLTENANNATASLRTQSTEDTLSSQSELVKTPSSRIAAPVTTGSTHVSPQTGTLTASLTQTTLLSNSSAGSVLKEDITTHDTGIPESATEISFALFGANTIVFSTSKPTHSSTGISSQISLTESATRGQTTIATNSSGADITSSESFPRNTNHPESSSFVHSTFNVSESAGVRTTAALSSTAPEKTDTVKTASVEPALSASISSGFNGSTTGISPEGTNTGKRPDQPDIEIPGLDSASLGPTVSTGAPASRKSETPQQSSFELSESGPISTKASASIDAGILGATKSVKGSSEVLSGSSGSLTTEATAPITALLPGTTKTAREGSIGQSGNGASVSTGESASLPATTPSGTNKPLQSDTLSAKPTITASGGGVFPVPVIIPGQSEPAHPLTSIVPKPDLSESNLFDLDSSTQFTVPGKSITVGLSDSVASEPSSLASSFLKTSVSISLTVPGASNAPQPTLSDRLGTIQSVSDSAEPSSVTPDAFTQESNRPGTDLPEGTTASLSKPLALVPSSQIDDSLPKFSGLPRLGSFIPDIPQTTDLGSTRTSNIEAPEATEPSASQSGGLRLASSGSKPATEPSVTSLPEAKTLSTDAPSEQTDSIPGKSALTVNRDGSPILSTSVIDISLSIKPSFAVQTDALTEKPSLISEGPPGLITSITRLPPQISVLSVTDLPQFVEPSRTSETGLSAGKTSQISDGSPILVPGATNLLSSIEPSLATQTDAVFVKATQTSDGLPTLVPGVTDILPSIEPSIATQTDAAPVKATPVKATQASDGLPTLVPGVTDILPSIEPSLATQTDAAPVKATPTLVPGVTNILPSIEPSLATQTDAAPVKATPTLVPGVTDILPSIEPSLVTQTDAVPVKATQASDGLPTVIPGATDILPSIEPSFATQTDAVLAKASQTTDHSLASILVATDLLSSIEPSRAIQTGSSTDEAPSSSASLVTDLPSSVPLPPVTDLLPVIEPSRSARTDLSSEKPASTSDLLGGFSVSVPSVTDSLPLIGPSLARQTFSASVSETRGGEQPSKALPIPIPVTSGLASATEDAPPIVISPTPSLPLALPSLSVPASLTDNTNSFTVVLPVVTAGPATSGDVPVEPSKSITASDDQATYDRLTITPPAGSETGLPVVIPISGSPAPSSKGGASPSLSSDILEGVPITASPAVPLTTEEPAKSITNLPPVILPQSSQTPIVSPPIPIDQSTFTAPATSKGSEVPASTGGIPPVIILPLSGAGSETSGSAASVPTGSQPLATATPGEASVTAGGSSAPILVGISDILTASSSNPGVSGYSSVSHSGSTPAAPSSGVIVEASGVSPSAGATPTGAPAGSASATNVESVSSNPAVTAGYSTAPLKAEGSGASGSQAVSVTSAVLTSNEYLPSGAVSAASSVETSKPVLGSEATASIGGATPVQATAQSSETSGGSTTPGAQANLVKSTGATELISGAASETEAVGARPSSADVSGLPSSVPNDVGSIKPGSTANIFPPSIAASAPSTITPLKEEPKTDLIRQSGSNVAVPTGTDTLTAQPIGSSILAEPSASMPTASADFPTGIPSSVPRIISPPDGVPNPPNNTTLCQIGFLYPLHYKFVLAHPQSQRQIFKYLPIGIADGLSIPLENVTMQTLRAYDTTEDLNYITTLALFFLPSQQMDLLQLDLHTPTHKIYNNSDPSVKTIMLMINPAIPLRGDNSLGTPSAPGSGNDGSSTSSDSGTANEGVPISGVNNSSPVRAKSVGIAAGVVCGAAAYGAAMFFVARRYRKRKQSHRRSPSMLSSPVLSGVSHDYMGVANTALMSGGRGDGDRSLTPHNGYYYERNSRGSGHSGSTGRQQISAPVMAENSLGWN